MATDGLDCQGQTKSIVPWTPFIPHKPHPKQLAALLVPNQEMLFGGAAGGGKSDWLLMAALQYVDIPFYSAIIFRKSLSDLNQEEALITRAHEWLDEWYPHVKYIPAKHAFKFPSGATLAFGYIGDFRTNERYQGAAYQFVGWDELTQHFEEDYLYLFSRCRRAQCDNHGGRIVDGKADPLPDDPNCKDCWRFAPLRRVPLRIRATCNPGGIGHCVPYGDVLMSNGSWKSISKIRRGESVYSVDGDGFLTVKRVIQKHSSTYNGSLKSVECRGLSIVCTPNHKVAKVRTSSNGFVLTPFNELPGQATILRSASWRGSRPSELFTVPTIKTRRRKHNQPTQLTWSLFARLFGWFITEGHCVDRDKAFGISQMKADHCESIESLLHECKFKFSTCRSGFLVYAPDWWNYFKQFGKCRSKFIPTEIKNLPRYDLRVLFNAMVGGDGHWQGKGGGQFYTTSQNLADDFQEVALKLGYITHQSARQRDNREGLSYCVNFKRTKYGGTEILTDQHVYNVDTHTKRKSLIEDVPFDGKVYCIGVEDNHNFIIRQNGSVWVSGNSWVKERFKIELDETTGRWLGKHPDRPFMPSRIEDNPSLDLEAYHKNLMQLDPLTREQLRYGYWGAPENARFKPGWFCRYEKSGDRIMLFYKDGTRKQFHFSSMQIYLTIDPAASAREGIAGLRFHQRMQPSHGVISCWAVTPSADLLWLDLDRMQTEAPEFLYRAKTMTRLWRPSFVVCEAIGVGLPIYQLLSSMGLPVEPIRTVPDKVANSAEAQVRAEQGKVFLPREAPWLKLVEDELFTWTGHPHQTADIVDTFSNACHQVTRLAGEDQFDSFMGAATAGAYDTVVDMPY